MRQSIDECEGRLPGATVLRPFNTPRSVWVMHSDVQRMIAPVLCNGGI